MSLSGAEPMVIWFSMEISYLFNTSKVFSLMVTTKVIFSSNQVVIWTMSLDCR